MTEPAADDTQALLEASSSGDRQALERLLSEELEWLRGHVSKRLFGEARAEAESWDIVQDVVVRILQRGSALTFRYRAELRAYLARAVQSALGRTVARRRSAKRSPTRERRFESETALWRKGESPHRIGETPQGAVERREQQDLIDEALDLLDPDDHDVVALRLEMELDWSQIGARLGLGPEQARSRFRRAMSRLRGWLGVLQRGDASQLDGA